MFSRTIHILTILTIIAAAFAYAPAATAGSVSCDFRTSDNFKKLLECVTLDGVRAHQAALQAIANANGGTRASGTPGYDASVAYVFNQMTSYGYRVTTQNFQFHAWSDLGPSILEQTAPVPTVYVEGTDYDEMSQGEPGEVTAPVTAIDVQLGPGNTSNSACEAADFAGFTAGNIALVQRGTCTLKRKPKMPGCWRIGSDHIQSR
jgi:hypothetical protein